MQSPRNSKPPPAKTTMVGRSKIKANAQTPILLAICRIGGLGGRGGGGGERERDKEAVKKENDRGEVGESLSFKPPKSSKKKKEEFSFFLFIFMLFPLSSLEWGKINK